MPPRVKHLRYDLRLRGGGRQPLPAAFSLPDVVGLLLGDRPAIYCTASEEEFDESRRFADRLGLALLDSGEPAPGRADGARFVYMGRDLLKLRDHPPANGGEDRAMGAFLGYPPCCIQAFVAWRDLPEGSPDWPDVLPSIARSTREPGAHPFLLNNLFNMNTRLRERDAFKDLEAGVLKSTGGFALTEPPFVLPWHPCSFRCAASLRHASRIWAFLEAFVPLRAKTLAPALKGDFLYLGKLEVALLESRRERAGVHAYARADLSRALFSEADAEAFRAGDRLLIERDGVRIRRGRKELARLARPGPLLLRFA